MNLDSLQTQAAIFATAFGHLRRGLAAAQTILLTLALLAGLAGAAVSALLLFQTDRQNRTIVQLERGFDLPADPSSSPCALSFARQYFLLQHDRLDEAQIFTGIAAPRCGTATRTLLFYNLANARVRQAFGLIEKGDHEKAIPYTGLAKNDYRQALRTDPKAWDAKYNFDVAQRLVRDLPRGQGEEEEPQPAEKEKPLWTDLPGLPRGLP
jgi:mxaK protein